MRKLLLILPILLLMTGCYNYRELNDLAIISAISISTSEEGFELEVQVVNPKKEQDTSSSNEPDFIVYKSSSYSIQEAFRLMLKESPKKMYATQMQILIIDESVAKEEISDILDYFARAPEIRNEFYVLIGKSEDILEILTPLDNISGQNITESLIANNKYLGYANLVTFNDLISNYQNDKIEIALPSIELIGNSEIGDDDENIETTDTDANILISTIGIFKDNKFAGYLTEEQSLAYNFIMDNISNTLITTEYNNEDYIVNEIVNSKTKLEADVEKKEISITISGKADVKEVNYDIDLTKEVNIRKIENDLNKKIETLILDSIEEINNEYDTDIYGFEDLFYKTDAKKYKENNWDDIFNDIDIDVKVDIEIVEQGNLLGGLRNE